MYLIDYIYSFTDRPLICFLVLKIHSYDCIYLYVVSDTIVGIKDTVVIRILAIMKLILT